MSLQSGLRSEETTHPSARILDGGRLRNTCDINKNTAIFSNPRSQILHNRIAMEDYHDTSSSFSMSGNRSQGFEGPTRVRHENGKPAHSADSQDLLLHVHSSIPTLRAVCTNKRIAGGARRIAWRRWLGLCSKPVPLAR